MEFNINDFGPVCYQLSLVLTCTIRNDVDCLIIIRINLSYLFEKQRYVKRINRRVLTDEWSFRRLQI